MVGRYQGDGIIHLLPPRHHAAGSREESPSSLLRHLPSGDSRQCASFLLEYGAGIHELMREMIRDGREWWSAAAAHCVCSLD